MTLHEQPGFKIIPFVWPSELLLAPCAEDAGTFFEQFLLRRGTAGNQEIQPEPGQPHFFIKLLNGNCPNHSSLHDPPRATRLQNDVLRLAFRIAFSPLR